MNPGVIQLVLLLIVAVACRNAPADVIFDMTFISSPGNSSDYNGHGSVSYTYQIGTYEVTVAQYAEFLNAVAASDPHGLYSDYMGGSGPGFGGPFINRSGTDGTYVYEVVPGTENQPVREVSFYDGLRLCNWMANGQGAGDTETGSYSLSDGVWLERQPSATWVLASENEWYKAAYYDPNTGLYYNYPNGSDTTVEPTDGTTPREMNYGDVPFWQGFDVVFTATGETTGYSACVVYDMGGNVEEWTDSLVPPGQGSYRVSCGGSFMVDESNLRRSGQLSRDPSVESVGQGFRLVYIPEPSSLLLLLTGAAFCVLPRRRQWLPRKVPKLADGRSIAEAALGGKIGTAAPF
jgi:formylglycine-generating enzyme